MSFSNLRFDYAKLKRPAKINGRYTYGERDTKTTAATVSPSNAAVSTTHSKLASVERNPAAGVLRRKPIFDEEGYFDEDEDNNTLEYIPAPGSPGPNAAANNDKDGNDDDDDDDEVDPLDLFMANIEQQISSSNKKKQVEPETKKTEVRADIEDEDNEESYYRYMEENPNAGIANAGDDDDVDVEYDEDGNPIVTNRKKIIDPLPPVDHSLIEYEPFEKDFYVVHEEIEKLSRKQVDDLRKTLNIKVTGPSPPKPVTSFAHFMFDEPLMKAIRKAEYVQPTSIQAQAIPAALLGRDLIGIAKTGSGKTAAFLWPMIIHVMAQRELADGDGPIGLILAPTRELSIQIYNEARKFGKVYNLSVICAYGGGSKWEQSKAFQAGAEIVVATPGRMIDFIKMKATNLKRVTFLVLDEADRMFNMGFEPQVRSICNHVRPDRQTLLFSATFKKRIEKLARDILTDPIRIVQGDIGEANTDVQQDVLVLKSIDEKLPWLCERLVQFQSNGGVLVFVTKKLDAELVASQLKLKEFDVLLLHGDMDQIERNKVITSFKRNEVSIMIATDVASRGLDIAHVRTVVNYDVARDIDTHTHRIGRTGRAGEKGTAYTLVTGKDKEFVGHLVRNLEGVNQPVPESLLNLALQSTWFRKSRFKDSQGKKPGVGGCGLGFKPRASQPNAARHQSASGDHESISETTLKSIEKSVTQPSRLEAIKSAFKAQYQNQFRSSSTATATITQPDSTNKRLSSTASDPPQPSSDRKTKKSRWQ